MLKFGSSSTKILTTFSLVLGLLVVTPPAANAASGTITNGACSATVGETTTAFIINSGSNCYAVFKSGSNSFMAPTGVTSATLLIIAGGGAGGSSAWAGGGGAGEVLTYTNYTVSSSSSVNVVVGSGGSGGTATLDASLNRSSNGGDSSVGAVVAKGGGAGASYAYGYTLSYGRGSDGGSGGGGTEQTTQQTGGLSIKSATTGSVAAYGNIGGYGSNGAGSQAGGGGGGAGSAGTNAGSRVGGAGGSGTNLFSSWLSAISSGLSGVTGWSTATTSGYIAGGGAGAAASSTSFTGGSGGGGNSGNNSSSSAVSGANAIANTGSGGGGASYNGTAGVGGSGGSGLVVFKFIASKTITFNSNFGTPTTSTQLITVGASTALSANTFSREGYVFRSWNTASDGSGTEYANSANITITDDLTLYANWTNLVTDSLKINLDASIGASLPSASTTWKSILPGSALISPTVFATAPTAAVSAGVTNETLNGVKSLKFSGSSSYINYGHRTETSNNGAAYTVETWINMSTYNASNWNIFASKWFADAARNGGGTEWHFGIYQGKLNVYTNSCSLIQYTEKSFSSSDQNTWFHAAFTVSTAGVLKIYLNGKPSANTASGCGPTAKTGLLILGDPSSATDLGLNGNMSRFRTYGKALSDAEMLKNFNGEAAGFGVSNTSQTISYAAGGGTGSAPTTPTSIAYGSTFTTPANTYTKSGYTFAGWSDGSTTYDAGLTYPATGSVSGDVTLTATWSVSLLAYESFDSSGSTVTGLTGGTGSSGFTGSWLGVNSKNESATSSTSIKLSNPDTRFRQVYPPGVGFSLPTTNKFAYTGGSTFFQQNIRQLSSAISMDVEKDYYFSFLSGAGNETQMMAGLMSDAPSTTSDTSKKSLLFGYGKDAGALGQFAIDYGSANLAATCPDDPAQTCTSTPTYSAKTNAANGYAGYGSVDGGRYFYFILAKISSTSSGNDTVRLKAFTYGSTIPASDASITWDVTYSTPISGTFKYVTAQLYGLGYENLDELRLTTSYESAVNPTSTKTLTLDANYSGGTTATQTVSTSVNSSVANPFTRTGYTFSGWNTNSDGTSGTNYASTGTYSTTALVNVSADTTLFAKWTANTYNVTAGTMTRLSADSTSTVLISSSPAAYSSTVTLTPSPAATMRLKSGTLAASSSLGALTLSGTGPYTFIMPAAAVTVTAQFELAETAPGAPSVTSITVSNAQLSVAFTEGTNAGSTISKYQYSTDDGATWKDRATGTTASPLVITTVSASSSLLVNATTYKVKIRAFNTISGEASTVVSVAPYAAPTLGVPTTGLSSVAMVSYTLTIPAAAGGSGNYTYAVSAGSLPPGLSLSGRVISGTPTTFATYSGIRVTATDTTSNLTVQSSAFTITITSSSQLPISIVTRYGSGGSNLFLGVQGGSGSGALTYTLDPNPQTSCQLSGSVLTPSFATGASGTCYVKVTKAADAAYTEVSSSRTAIFFTAYVPVVTQSFTCPAGTVPSNPSGIGVGSCMQVLSPVSTASGDAGAAPKITALSIFTGLVNASVIITGTGFSSATKVQFGSKPTTTFTKTSTTITVNVPMGATTGRVMVFSPTGTAMAAQIFTVISPDTRAPSYQSGNVNTSTPTQLNLNFDESLASSGILSGAFGVSVDGLTRGVSSVSISGSTITLTLVSAISTGQAVLFTYTSPGDATSIQDAAGNKTATITATTLTNTL